MTGKPNIGATSDDTDAMGADPGAMDRRDATLDAFAREGMQPKLADYVPPPATADVEESIADARAQAGLGELAPEAPPVHDPIDDVAALVDKATKT